MHLNLLHRPAGGYYKEYFKLQQNMAHELKLKVTLLVQYSFMNDKEMIELVKNYESAYGDEIGIWFGQLQCPEFDEKVGGRDNSIWLYSKEDKEKIFNLVINKYREVFNQEPVSVGAYHLDSESLKILKRICPSIKVAVAGCFEEGVKVFHGCNNSWYLFNEGMPWGPWYPSITNSLKPAQTQEEAFDIVAVPHLSRDLSLSYEGRNDFFASHPANVQRGMANQGAVCPYSLNLVDQYRMQEDFNDGLSYYHVFVGANWLSNNPNVEDSDEITQGLYRELLEYFVELRSKGQLVDMHMREFSEWFKENIPVGKPQVYLAKEMLYGSDKHYFWYIDSYLRVVIDTIQGGSIGDLRPYAGCVEKYTGPDSKDLMIGSYPYIIHSQYRTGIAHHHNDGSRTTLIVNCEGENIDLATCRTHCAKVERDEKRTHIRLTPAELRFKNGVTAYIETNYYFERNGQIIIERNLSDISDSNAVFTAVEYFKGCYGVTEYPQDMHGITLGVDGDDSKSLEYDYKCRTIRTSNAKAVSALIPQVNTEVVLEALGEVAVLGTAVEGYVFNPYYTLTLESKLISGKGLRTCIWIKKIN